MESPNTVSHLELCFYSTNACRDGDCAVAMGTSPPPARQVSSVPHTCAFFKVHFAYLEIMEGRPFRF